ncbi:efflux RND transporter periplasmic adaptor subunit [Granulicella mallensis]|uniref:Efflux transporter, RND family, MFP subunit n=1 Tax=Granulicella mallensis (strain ATCC BAA-1857 / DSM 23137 / MP5ACTX8) TaxID=682795 RepID=G8P1T6_GRAMM|nr:efflux RND transporter periplasmic adaptor subunit [Granulicella mallensis]AEU35911.1 efflux transporter, RND family, MFP subunit [Granulicella mallensis MP5ACTX8]
MSLKKIALIVLGFLLLVGIVAGTIIQSRSSVTAVTTSKAVPQDLIATVSGTGQIKPKTGVNVGATAFGRVTHLYVKEGDHVKAGQLVATVESAQPASAVDAQKAAIASSKTDVESNIAAEKTARANIDQAKADLEQKKFDFDRAKSLYQDQLIAKQDYDAKKAAYDVSAATLQQRIASFSQARAQTSSARGHVDQAIATLAGNDYSLGLTQSRAPFDALVTNVPIREGETVVTGIQNAEGSTLMTLADMSVITAEVKIDETDIVNVAMNQPVDVTVDALPGKIFKGHVTEVGDQALLRTTGLATSQSTTGTEEAKDFKVIVTLDKQQSDDLRPGLSCTAKITTAHKPNTLTVPIQSLVQRDAASEKALFNNHGKEGAAGGPITKSNLTQGVYIVVQDNGQLRVKFVPITTGVTGATDIEVLSGLKDGDEVVTGRYKVLRTLKSGTAIKHDTALQTATDDNSSS